MTNKKIQAKKRIDWISKSIIFILAISGIAVLVLLFSLILKEAVPAYRHYGIFHMYFTADFSEQGGWGIWGALSVTLITSIVAVLIALPIALRAAFFIKFRMKKGQKGIKLIINILAGVPSVVFGIFALSSLTAFTSIFGYSNATSIFVGIVVLIIMIFPTLVSLISNQLDLVPQDLVNASISLGNTKTYTLYKVVKKSIRQGVYVSAIVALGRAMGETMALSMILQFSPLSNPLSGGVGSFLNSSGASLGVLIARNMFSDSSDPNHRAALFAAGIALFVMVMILISIVVKVSKSKKMANTNPLAFKEAIKREAYPSDMMHKAALYIQLILLPWKIMRYVIVHCFEMLNTSFEYFKILIAFPFDRIIYPKRTKSNREYFIKKSKYKLSKVPDVIREALEIISIALIIGVIGWIVLDIFIKGVPNWNRKDWSWSYYEWTPIGKIERPGAIGNTMVFTLVLVLISIAISLPLALATALYLSEYARNKKTGSVIKFFLDSLGGTPSILFGMFGIIFFRQMLNIGNGGFSLIAGALTMVIVILPTFTRSIEQVLTKIPDDLRMASYSLGASKFETLRKIVVPQALPGIITGVILSAGRVIAETAPVFLTIGMLGNIHLSADGSGWTMTTKILYNQIFSTSSSAEMLSQSYAIAAASLLLITMLILFSESIKPIVQKKLISRYVVRPIKHISLNIKGVKYVK